jgi:hypothetical protein
MPEGVDYITDLEFNPAPSEVKCWGDVAHLMGEKTVVCKECKQRGELMCWFPAMQTQLVDRQLCFSCNTWMDKVNEQERGKTFYVTSKYDCYSLGPEPSKESWRNHKGDLGFGGRRWEFELRGDITHHIVSHNVWYGGEVPEHFRDRLKANCTIIPRTGYNWGY